MGIYDRDYIRRRPAAGMPGRPGRLVSVRMWSVNTWLIVLCVAVFVIDGFTPTKAVPVSETLPAHVTLSGGGPQYREDPSPERVGNVPMFQTRVWDVSRSPPEEVGRILYSRMHVIERWMYFSTERTFLKPLHAFEFWRFIGFQFLHANLTHLLFNMIGLFFFGSLVERHLGPKRYLAFYLLCGICGALMYLLLNLGGFVAGRIFQTQVMIPGLLFNSPYTPLMGASAGVFGVLMAGAYLAPHALVLLFFILPMRLATLAYALVAIAFLSVLLGGPNAGGEAGHIGGAIAGFYFIRRPHHLHGFFDVLGWIDPTSHHYRGAHRPRAGPAGRPPRAEVDAILDKINRSGLHSLTEREKRILREASDR